MSLVGQKRTFLQQQTTELRAKLSALDRQRAQKEAERETIGATIGKLEAVIPVVQQRVDIRKTLLNQEFGSRVQYLEMLPLLVEQQQELLVQKSHQREAEAAVATIVETRAQAAAEYRRTLYGELTEAERKAAGFPNISSRRSSAPNCRFSLRRSTRGAAARHPYDRRCGDAGAGAARAGAARQPRQIEAMVSNRDIGFVHADQDAEVKVDTFSFTRYGLLHGKVLSVSQDAIVRDKPADKSNDKAAGAETSTSEPRGQELQYAARVSLDHTRMQIEDKLVNLSPGMAVTVEIKTGSRTLISYLLSPVMKYKQESLRER